MSFQLNPNLDLDQLRKSFAENRRLRIDELLTLESAEAILDTLANYTAWHLVHSDEMGMPVRLDSAQLEATDSNTLTETIVELQKRASSSYQYMYKFFPMIDAIKAGTITESSLLYQIASFLNGTEFIKFARDLTQTDSLVKVDTQATLFEPGHFLNLHDDMNDHRDAQDQSVRRFAIVLGFTKNWSVNWGGQTCFFSGAVSPISEAWYPGFNNLTIFEVPALHSVNYVTPFAQKGRYSITGWLRDDPSVQRPDLDSTLSSN